MPIKIRQGAEPYSRRALGGTGDALGLIESSAYRLLRNEARRYIQGSTRGRSFLVAGHRGSGKTTLVLHVCQELIQRPLADTHHRPLLVLLHGPNLLPPTKQEAGHEARDDNEDANGEEKKEKAEGGKTAPKDAAPAEAVSEDEAQNALTQITLGLYRALTQEFAARYRQRMLPRDGEDPSSPRARERMELAAQLELELDRCPEPARLREFWERGGFLRDGLLRETLRPGTQQGFPPDQGYRELLALSSACEMYRRISGTLTSERESKGEAASEESAETSIGNGDQDFLTPLAVLLTGGLVGTGAFAADVSGPWSAFTGLLASLGAATSFKITSSRSRKRSYTEETKLVRDLSVDTLDRELPVLIRRAREAGLVPLFVVDELDKIEGFSQRITSLVRRLKKLVAERAFFCFLTDRSYFEEMRRRTSEQAYPIEYTYFTHRLFIVFDPLDFHRYLGEVLELTETERVAGSLSTPAVLRASDSHSASEERADFPILPYVVLHQAKMHAIDLQRRLVDLRKEDGSLRLKPGALRNRANSCDVVIQVAVEMVLDQEEVREWLRRDPPFRRLFYDALYYPSRKWELAEYEIDLTDDQQGAFGESLIQRMGSEEKDNDGKNKPMELPPADLRFLYKQTRRLCDFLCDRETFQGHFSEWERRRQEGLWRGRLKNHALTWSSMESFLGLVFPLLEREDEHRYQWRFNRAGLPMRAEVVQDEAMEIEMLAREQEGHGFDVLKRIRGMADFLAEISQ